MARLDEAVRRFDYLKRTYRDRDITMRRVAQVRAGDTSELAPGLFPDEWPKGVTANFIDTVARDLAEVIAPLPSINCSSTAEVDDRVRRKADRRTQIANHYVEASRLQTAMFTGADDYLTYGFLPFRVEPNLAEGRPHIHVESPLGGYPQMDRWGRVVAYANRYLRTAGQLAADFPEYADRLVGNGDLDRMVELVRWADDEATLLFTNDASPLLLARIRNPLGRCPVFVAQRPGGTGQFDDVIWLQVARAYMGVKKLEAVELSVDAPIALPSDVQHLPMGSNAIFRSATPEKIRRVPLEVPSGVFAEESALQSDMRLGSRYPEGRSGSMDASIITGKGVQALMGGFDTQVKTAQAIIGEALQDAIAACFELDETLWPTKRKEVSGHENGAPYTLTYTPGRDIKGNYAVNIEYGLMAGLDPNRALVWGLQARADKLVSRSWLRQNLPVAMNVTQEEATVDIEDGRDALKQALAGYVQAIPVMAQNGQDPGEIVRAMTVVIDARKKGKPIEEAVAEAFAPPEPPPAAEAPPGEGMPGEPAGPGDSVPEGMRASGLLEGVAPGQAGMGAGGRADLATMMASLTSGGQPNLSVGVSRRQPI